MPTARPSSDDVAVTTTDLSLWKGVPRPQRIEIDGRYARLEPLSADRHEADLFASAIEPGADARFAYLFDDVPADAATFHAWMDRVIPIDDPLFYAVVDKSTGRAEGRHALMRIDPVHGVIEIGHVLWGPAIARTRVATEALYLSAEYVFETLGYRRFEWKCNDRNEPSKRAALRFGFAYEGLFRQHMVAKGRNRDTAWFAMIDSEWPALKASYQAWLSPDNFDQQGRQLRKLEDFRA
jgi:RimJ/RimL family protein N-acetyltransferase